MANETIHSFQDLDCWKACRQLRIFVASQVVTALPKDERYRLGDQLVRAARSTTANIAEGYGRFHYADNSKFVSNARGSCHEVVDHLITAHDEGFISEAMMNDGKQLTDNAIRLLNGYMSYLRRSATNNK